MGNFSLRIRSVTLEKEIVGICGRLHRSDYFFDCICHCWMATATSVYNRSANQRMIPSLQSRCGRHSCAMQQRVVPRGLIRGSLGLNPPAHPIILTGAKQAAEPRRARAAEAQHSQGRPVRPATGAQHGCLECPESVRTFRRRAAQLHENIQGVTGRSSLVW